MFHLMLRAGGPNGSVGAVAPSWPQIPSSPLAANDRFDRCMVRGQARVSIEGRPEQQPGNQRGAEMFPVMLRGGGPNGSVGAGAPSWPQIPSSPLVANDRFPVVAGACGIAVS